MREKEIDEVGEGEKELTSCPAAAREGLLEEDVAPFRMAHAPGSTAIGLRRLPFGARGPGMYCRDGMAHFSYWASY